MRDPDRYLLPEYDPEQDGAVQDAAEHLVELHHEDTNLRLILDADQVPTETSDSAPDVFIERHKDHWLIILHPDSGDPLVLMELYEDHLRLEYGRGMLSNVYETTIPL